MPIGWLPGDGVEQRHPARRRWGRAHRIHRLMMPGTGGGGADRLGALDNPRR